MRLTGWFSSLILKNLGIFGIFNNPPGHREISNMAGKIVNDPEFGEIMLRKGFRYKKISISVRPEGSIRISLPAYLAYSAGMTFFEANRGKIREIRKKLAVRAASRPKMSEQDIVALRKLAKAWLPARLQLLASHYGFTYGRVAIKNNRTNWGSCSARNNINLNLHLMRLPEHLRDYVILHELCHLKYQDHGENFHKLLEQLLQAHFGGNCGDDGTRGRMAGRDAADKDAAGRGTAAGGTDYPLTRRFEKEIRQYRTY